MLEIVRQDAHEPGAERHRGIETVVDDPVEGCVVESVDEPNRSVVHFVVVTAEEGRRRAYVGDVFGRLAVSGRRRVEGQRKAFVPPRRSPDLLTRGGVGDVIVLNTRQMPDEPRDRVRRRIESVCELVDAQAVDDPVQQPGKPVESFAQDRRTASHRSSTYPGARGGKRLVTVLMRYGQNSTGSAN